MRVKHFIFTRFSFRPVLHHHAFPGWISDIDPLEPRRLENRFLLFEMFCLPSILQQTSKDFWWILIVDPSLEICQRDRLKKLCIAHPQTQIVDYNPKNDLGSVRWLASFIGPETTHVATTNLDDDDLISIDFVDRVHHFFHMRITAGNLPSWVFLGCQNQTQWDFISTREAPLGYVKPWHRGKFPTSAGFTFICDYFAYDLSILLFHHSLVRRYFDSHYYAGSHGQPDLSLLRLRKAGEKNGENWHSWTSMKRVFSMESAHPMAVIVNHIDNDQSTRLFERAETRRPVDSAIDFPNMAVSFEKIQKEIGSFSREPLNL